MPDAPVSSDKKPVVLSPQGVVRVNQEVRFVACSAVCGMCAGVLGMRRYDMGAAIYRPRFARLSRSQPK